MKINREFLSVVAWKHSMKLVVVRVLYKKTRIRFLCEIRGLARFHDYCMSLGILYQLLILNILYNSIQYINIYNPNDFLRLLLLQKTIFFASEIFETICFTHIRM
jgi:hypothetical protein